MTEAEIQIIDAARELIDANVRARDELDAANQFLQRGIDHLESGGSIIEALTALPVSSRRQATQDAFKRVVEARHLLRLRAISVCIDEGMRPSQIGETWGISRQRVDHYIQELKAGPTSTPA